MAAGKRKGTAAQAGPTHQRGKEWQVNKRQRGTAETLADIIFTKENLE